jgi:hypothetical protein
MIVLEPSLVPSAGSPMRSNRRWPTPPFEGTSAPMGADSCVPWAERRHFAASGGPVKRPLIYRLLRLHGDVNAVRRGKGGAPSRPAGQRQGDGPSGPSTIRREEVNMSDDNETLDADEYLDIEDLVRRHLAPGEFVDEATVISYLRFAAAAIEKQHQSG